MTERAFGHTKLQHPSESLISRIICLHHCYDDEWRYGMGFSAVATEAIRDLFMSFGIERGRVMRKEQWRQPCSIFCSIIFAHEIPMPLLVRQPEKHCKGRGQCRFLLFSSPGITKEALFRTPTFFSSLVSFLWSLPQ